MKHEEMNSEMLKNPLVEYLKPRAKFIGLVAIDVVMFYLIFFLAGSWFNNPSWFSLATTILLAIGLVFGFNATTDARRESKRILNNLANRRSSW